MSKVGREFGETIDLEKRLAVRRLVDQLVFQDPGRCMGNEDRVEAGRQRRINVRSRAVADHPGTSSRELMPLN